MHSPWIRRWRMVVSELLNVYIKEALKLCTRHTQLNTKLLPTFFMHSCYLINTWRSLQFLFLFCLISTILAISSAFSNTHTIWFCKFHVSLDFATVWWIFNHCLLPSTAIFLLWCPWLSSMPVSVEYSTHKRFSTLCYLLPVMLVMMCSGLCTNHSVTY